MSRSQGNSFLVDDSEQGFPPSLSDIPQSGAYGTSYGGYQQPFFPDPSSVLQQDPNSAFSRTTSESGSSASYPPNQNYFGQESGRFSLSSLGSLGRAAFQQFSGGDSSQAISSAGSWLANSGEEAINKIKNSTLRNYFSVNNLYVLSKLPILLFPFTKPDWSRKRLRNENDTGPEEFLPPRDDVNAPDLYIPTMAFISYILLMAVIAGIRDKYTPESILTLTGTSFGISVMSTLVFLFLLYIFSAARVTFTLHLILDVVAFVMYSYVPLVLGTLFYIIFKPLGYIVWIVTLLSYSYWLYQTVLAEMWVNRIHSRERVRSQRLGALIIVCAQIFFVALNIFFSLPAPIKKKITKHR